MIITREEIRELAQFEADSPHDCALSFYFAPHTPQNKSHREEAILAKDLVRSESREEWLCAGRPRSNSGTGGKLAR
jgi:hypothetical protein